MQSQINKFRPLRRRFKSTHGVSHSCSRMKCIQFIIRPLTTRSAGLIAGLGWSWMLPMRRPSSSGRWRVRCETVTRHSISPILAKFKIITRQEINREVWAKNIQKRKYKRMAKAISWSLDNKTSRSSESTCTVSAFRCWTSATKAPTVATRAKGS